MAEAATFMQTVTEYGYPVVLSGLFLWQWYKSQDKAEQREEKLYSVIETLKTALPQIMQKLDTIENNMK